MKKEEIKPKVYVYWTKTKSYHIISTVEHLPMEDLDLHSCATLINIEDGSKNVWELDSCVWEQFNVVSRVDVEYWLMTGKSSKKNKTQRERCENLIKLLKDEPFDEEYELIYTFKEDGNMYSASTKFVVDYVGPKLIYTSIGTMTPEILKFCSKKI